MNIERRLLHAARDLREVPIDVPALTSGRSAPRRSLRFQAVAAPLLFVVGGLFAVGGVISSTPQRDSDIIDSDIIVSGIVEDSAGDIGADAASPVNDAVLDGPLGGQIIVPSTSATFPISALAPSVVVELEMIAANASRRTAEASSSDERGATAARSTTGPLDGPL